MCVNQLLTWYAAYGSNLLYEDGFLCYIKGGVRRGCSKRELRCRDNTPPIKIKPTDIPFHLYFAEQSSKWNNVGVAFIGLSKDENNLTVGRRYLITKEQIIHVWKQESKKNNSQEISIDDFEEIKRKGSKVFCKSRYGNIVYLGDDEGHPIYTFTHYKDIGDQKLNFTLPSNKYIQIIADGLEETRNWTEEEIADYLIRKDGIKGKIDKENLIRILRV